MGRSTAAFGIAALLIGGMCLPARATEATPSPAAMSASELGARLHFLEQRLNAGQPTALAWEWGWTGLHAVEFTRNMSDAINADEGDNRVRAIVDAAKSGLATVQMGLLLGDPLGAGDGAGPMWAVPGDDRAARLQRLAVGERQLMANAERAETRYSVSRHLVTVGANLLGGAAILAFGVSRDAVRSTLVGLAVGEAQIWSQPWRATADLRDYRATFPKTPEITWELRPMGSGLQLAIHF